MQNSHRRSIRRVSDDSKSTLEVGVSSEGDRPPVRLPWMPVEESKKEVETSKIIIHKGSNKIFKHQLNSFQFEGSYIACLCENNFTDKERKNLLKKFLNQFMTTTDPNLIKKKYCLVIVTDAEEPGAGQCPLCFGSLLERFVLSSRVKDLLQDARVNAFGTGCLPLGHLRNVVAAQEAARAPEDAGREWKFDEWNMSEWD